ncbi:AraC family transcriptional regulator [Microbacterium betulae]|uniref:HTH-type transcriptional regulator RipA n=1 Tax=Microbacterium betulae TaxID=2981139 RepID=A0AA97I6B2_9MICO|nr:AraC family transcriptional regulator [Microbacterium sp. AB]WOF22962.1 AraC family transcriptional regulator [Microbacterium sp. AB]
MHTAQLVDSVRHTHGEHELTWVAAGELRLTIGVREWTVDAARALWIPAGIPHLVRPARNALALPLFFPSARWPSPYAEPRAVPRSEELDALARTLAQPGLATPSTLHASRRRLLDIVAAAEAPGLPLPHDPRAREIADALVADPSRPETLEEWGRIIHVSAKTLQRSFSCETGMRFPEWRTRLRLRTAHRLLTSDETIASISSRVGYASCTAFIDAFRREYGDTPAHLRRTGDLSAA